MQDSKKAAWETDYQALTGGKMRLINFMLYGRSKAMFFFALGLATTVVAGFVAIAVASDHGLAAPAAERWLCIDLGVGVVALALLIRDTVTSWWPAINSDQLG